MVEASEGVNKAEEILVFVPLISQISKSAGVESAPKERLESIYKLSTVSPIFSSNGG